MAKVVKVSEKPKSNSINSIDELGSFIKYQRTKLGLTRENVASMCSINFQTLSNIENGNPRCDVGKVINVAMMLGIKLVVDIEEE